MAKTNPYEALRTSLQVGDETYEYFDLTKLEDARLGARDAWSRDGVRCAHAPSPIGRVMPLPGSILRRTAGSADAMQGHPVHPRRLRSIL